MLTIRLQRLGRKGHPTYRIVVQDIRQSPTSGKVVALLGNYDPHSKSANLVREKAEFYLSNGAKPSDRIIRLFNEEGIKLPEWVKDPTKRSRDIRNPEKLRRNQPKDEASAEEGEGADVQPAETTESQEQDQSADANESNSEEVAQHNPDAEVADNDEAVEDGKS